MVEYFIRTEEDKKKEEDAIMKEVENLLQKLDERSKLERIIIGLYELNHKKS